MRHVTLLSALIAAFLLASCHHRSHKEPAPVYRDAPVSIEIEVYDPATGYVWQDVSVRIIEVDHEWSGCICPNPTANDFYFTDKFGVVFFSPEFLGAADLGFLLDGHDRAVLSPDFLEDEATVLVEISAPGLGRVYERIELSWDRPDVYVRVPF